MISLPETEETIISWRNTVFGSEDELNRQQLRKCSAVFDPPCVYTYDVQEESTHINVRSYWPSVVASGAMLLATDALSIERTLGSYMLSSCDLSNSQLAQLAYLQGSAELLLKFAMTYGDNAGELLDQHIYNTSLQRNITKLRAMILDEGFEQMCKNLTESDRKKLVVRWADDIQLFILTVDELRGSYVIPSILQVNYTILLMQTQN